MNKDIATPAIGSNELLQMLKQYGCGPIEFVGSHNAFFERHLVFDNVINLDHASRTNGSRPWPGRCVMSCLSAGCSRRRPTARPIPSASIISQWSFSSAGSWPTTSPTCCSTRSCRRWPKRHADWPGILEQEPDAGLGNGGLGRLAACFLDSMATMQIPAMGYGLRYEYGMFKQSIKDGWQQECPDNWLRRPDPWEVARPNESVHVFLNCTFKMDAGNLRAIPGQPSQLIGIPYDRPIVGFGGKNINTLRLWAAASPDYFDFQKFSSGDFVGALAEMLGTFLWKPKKEYHSGTVDRCAILSLAVLFITKIGMHFAAGHDAIVLKCMGCIAIGIGTIWMALVQLNAFFPEESEFPAIPASSSGSTSSEARSRTINGEESISQEKPLGLRRLARLDHGGEGRRSQAYRQNF